MKRVLIIALTIVSLGCSRVASNGIEIESGQFDRLIRSEQIKTLVHISQCDLLQIELKPTALEGFRHAIDDLKAEGKIKSEEEFRLYFRIVDIDFMTKRIRKIEKENELSPIRIRRSDDNC